MVDEHELRSTTIHFKSPTSIVRRIVPVITVDLEHMSSHSVMIGMLGERVNGQNAQTPDPDGQTDKDPTMVSLDSSPFLDSRRILRQRDRHSGNRVAVNAHR